MKFMQNMFEEKEFIVDTPIDKLEVTGANLP